MMREAEFIQRVFREAAPIVLGGDRTAEAKETALGVYDVVTDSDVRTEEFVLSDGLPERLVEEFRRTKPFLDQLNRAVQYAYEEM